MGLKMDTKTHPIIWMILVAIVAGVGQLLASEEKLTWRIVLGRALSSGALAMSAGTALIWYPDLNPMQLIGISAVLASLGTSGLERLFQSFFGKGK